MTEDTPANHITRQDDFWMTCVSRLGSNSAVDGFESLSDLIASGRLTARELRSLSSALRSLSGRATDGAAAAEDRVKRPWAYRAEAAE